MANGRPGRPKGLPKTGGRQKGTPNKATAPIRESIQERDPIGKLFALYEIAMREENYDLAQRTLATILPYGLPRLTASQIDLALPRGPVTVNVHPAAKKPKRK